MTWTIVEEPSPYQPVDVWRAFLARLEAMDRTDEGVKLSIERARETIALLESHASHA